MEKFVELELWRQLVVLIPLGIFLAICAFTDLKERKVYNKITYPAFGVGLLVHAIAFGPMGFVWAFVAALATFVICLVFFVFIPAGGFGGGDLKLLTATAAFVGGKGIMAVSWYAVLFGGVFGIAIALYHGYVWRMLKNFYGFFRGILRSIYFRSGAYMEKMEVEEATRVPYAAAVFCGAATAYLEAMTGWPGWYARWLHIITTGGA